MHEEGVKVPRAKHNGAQTTVVAEAPATFRRS